MSFFSQQHKGYVRIGFDAAFTQEESDIIHKYIGGNGRTLEDLFKKCLLKEAENELKDKLKEKQIMKIGDKLRELRTQNGYTIEFVARNIGVSYASMQYWDSGKQMPSIKNLKKLADFYKVTVDYLMEE